VRENDGSHPARQLDRLPIVVSAVAAERTPGPSGARRLGAAVAIDALGSGMFIPVSFIYFIAITPLSTVRIGLALTIASLLSIPFALLIGSFVDRFGARPILQAANVLQAVGFAGYTRVDTFSGVLVCAWIVALGRACYLGSYGVIVTALSDTDNRELTFGRLYAIRNLGYAAGGFLAGLAISIGTHTVYTSIVAADATSFLVALALISKIPNTRRTRQDRSQGAWRTALSDRPYRLVIAAQFFLTASAFALNFVFPVYLTRQLGLPGWLAGGVFTFNALLVGFAQRPTVRAVTGRIRARVLAVAYVSFAIGYLVMLTALHRPTAVADAIVVVGTLMYTMGELLASPITATLAVEAAPGSLLGRYLSLNQLALSLATALSPVLYACLLARGPSTTWLTLTMLALGGIALAIAAERVLPQAQARVGRPHD
jgi:MFS family permease